MTALEDAAAPAVSFLQSRLGLTFSGPRRARLLALVERQRAAARLSPEDFAASLAAGGQAYDLLVAEVTVGETSFFRDRTQCELLRTIVLPAAVHGSGPERHLTMWSAGCASGEEAFTLAALADEAGVGAHCTVVGSDASRPAITKARAGAYGSWSMRSTTPTERAAHFREQDGRWLVAPALRERTRFVQRNLLDGPPPPGRFDVVLCRNLLIYLTRDAVRRVAEILVAALTRDGWLITAAGDPPLEAPGLEAVRTSSGLAYRRADARGLHAAGVQVARSAAGPTPTPVAPPGARPRSSAPEAARGSPPAPATAPAPAAPSASDLAQQVRLLGNSGRVTEACRAALAAAEAHPLDVELRYLAGAVLLEAGRLDEAAAAATAAVYLGPQEPAAHVLLGQVEHARGESERARRSFRNGSRLLALTPGEAHVALAGDVPAGHLAAIATRYLSTRRAGP